MPVNAGATGCGELRLCVSSWDSLYTQVSYKITAEIADIVTGKRGFPTKEVPPIEGILKDTDVAVSLVI